MDINLHLSIGLHSMYRCTFLLQDRFKAILGQMQKCILGALHMRILELTVQQDSVIILIHRHVSRTRYTTRIFVNFHPSSPISGAPSSHVYCNNFKRAPYFSTEIITLGFQRSTKCESVGFTKCTYLYSLTFIGPCIVIYSCSKTNQKHQFHKLFIFP
jgi:hypothetical protein